MLVACFRLLPIAAPSLGGLRLAARGDGPGPRGEATGARVTGPQGRAPPHRTAPRPDAAREQLLP